MHVTSALAQKAYLPTNVESQLKDYFQTFKANESEFKVQPQMVSYDINTKTRNASFTVSDIFAAQEFSPDLVNKIYKKVKKLLPNPYDDYNIKVLTTGVPIEELVPNRLSDNADKRRIINFICFLLFLGWNANHVYCNCKKLFGNEREAEL